MANHTPDHDFHIPGNSIWPPLSCLGVGLMAFGFVALLHGNDLGVVKDVATLGMVLGLAILAVGCLKWFGTLIHESNSRGFKTVPLVLDLANRYGMVFFIVSEIFFFAAFFAAYFYIRSFNPEWPPSNIHPMEIGLPAINTLILLNSGVMVTLAHHALLQNRRAAASRYVMFTYLLGLIFLALQIFEYGHAAFGMNSGAYGSTFYLLTGFHGFHVFLGSLMLMGVHYRLAKGDFSEKHHFYFEGAAWYWHFVDVVWIGLFLLVYLI